MMFDADIQDNRRIIISKPVSGSWAAAMLDFTRDGVWNGGGKASLSPGNRIDDIFFFPGFTDKENVEFYIDDVVFFDADMKDEK
jgi:hypothetical protein